jgi:hypothetical protein
MKFPSFTISTRWLTSCCLFHSPRYISWYLDLFITICFVSLASVPLYLQLVSYIMSLVDCLSSLLYIVYHDWFIYLASSFQNLLYLLLVRVNTILASFPSPKECPPPYIIYWSLHSIMSLITSSPSSLFITCHLPCNVYTQHLLISLFRNVLHLFLRRVNTITSLFSSPLQQCLPPYIIHLSLHSIMSLTSTRSSLFITCHQLFLYLPCNVYTQHLLISLFRNVLHLFLRRVNAITSLFSSPLQQCLPPYIIHLSLHSIISLTSTLSSLIIMCPYHLSLDFPTLHMLLTVFE